jgi:hypothetical protein
MFTLFEGTSGAVSVGGNPFPVPERDYYWDAGFVHRLSPDLKLEQDNYFRLDRNYLDEGQFGFVPLNHRLTIRGGTAGEPKIRFPTTASISRPGSISRWRVKKTSELTLPSSISIPMSSLIWIHIIFRSHRSVHDLGGIAYRWRDWLFALDTLFDTGLRAGFANTEGLPNVWQVNLSAAKQLNIPWFGQITDRVMLLNIFDRTNLIRPPNGIGVFQSAYGPRITVYNALTIPLPH